MTTTIGTRGGTFTAVDRDEVPFGSRRQAAERTAADIRLHGGYARAIFRPELGGWGVLVRAWA